MVKKAGGMDLYLYCLVVTTRPGDNRSHEKLVTDFVDPESLREFMSGL